MLDSQSSSVQSRTAAAIRSKAASKFRPRLSTQMDVIRPDTTPGADRYCQRPGHATAQQLDGVALRRDEVGDEPGTIVLGFAASASAPLEVIPLQDTQVRAPRAPRHARRVCAIVGPLDPDPGRSRRPGTEARWRALRATRSARPRAGSGPAIASRPQLRSGSRSSRLTSVAPYAAALARLPAGG
jgi:hypothetical protein